MIKKEEMLIVSSENIALDTFEMVLKNSYISQTAVPGQFLHIEVRGHTLRRPISIANVNQEEETTTILFKVIGSGTKELSTYEVGTKLNVLGPSGNGFNLDFTDEKTVLLIGGGIGVPPLYNLGRTLKAKGLNIISVLGFQTKASIFYEDKFQALGKTYITTDDGSYSTKGFVTDVAKTLTGLDRYYTCGPVPMIRAVMNSLEGVPGYISLEERMGCGIGACYACVIPDKDNPDGYKKICEDGPVFAANEVAL